MGLSHVQGTPLETPSLADFMQPPVPFPNVSAVAIVLTDRDLEATNTRNAPDAVSPKTCLGRTGCSAQSGWG